MSKPITLWGLAGGPNPWKVIMILEELNLAYDHKMLEMADIKKAPYEKICVNGRVPAIEDPNTGITLWESAAIIEYLVETYGQDKDLTFTSGPEKFLVKQWVFFQASGQGPYYGQAGWFAHYHHEKLPSAIERYREHVKRVLGVLNKALEGKQYLVGEKCTIADLSFIAWDMMLPWMFGEAWAGVDVENKFPNYFAWNKRLLERPAVQKAVKAKAAVSKI
ncbi:hypothetical protein HYFRA_00002580 [Hymenoscyphus fraxineus]|uniref:Glutathione S-transferase n=1 Tax=Hymenoscyphus fraxineus TaxID=746836 RepID=A0A9N9PZ42_9HELO|nr:hypothetical protein HYFRA_00002580 [Hymenoscyphus fraxineus]